MSLCEAEKTYILHSVEENFRLDGREKSDYRPMDLETSVVSHAFGSARLRLANTDVLVAIKVEVDTPSIEQLDKGKIEFFVDCSANATPDFEGRGGDDLALKLSHGLMTAYKSESAFDLHKLCILRGRKCWKLFVDILLLECGGNLYDAVSIAVKAALWDVRLPKITSITEDGTRIDLEVSTNLNECVRLDIENAPLMVTVCKIGDHYVVDPTAVEEQCSSSAVVISVAKNKFTNITQLGLGSIMPTTLMECIKFGETIAVELNGALLDLLKQPPSKSVGF